MQRRLRSKTAMVFMVTTMLFTLAFPTLMSAMSGYDSNVVSRVQDGDDNLVPFDKYARVLYVIHDGWRVGEQGDYWIREMATPCEQAYCSLPSPSKKDQSMTEMCR